MYSIFVAIYFVFAVTLSAKRCLFIFACLISQGMQLQRQAMEQRMAGSNAPVQNPAAAAPVAQGFLTRARQSSVRGKSSMNHGYIFHFYLAYISIVLKLINIFFFIIILGILINN